jgi:hypothetical protein
MWKLTLDYGISYVKNGGSNLNTRISAFNFIMKCVALSLEERFQKTCFGHDFSKACQYVTSDEKVYRGFKYVSIKCT